MINNNMRSYDYYTYGADNEYGQPALLTDADGKPIAQGTIKIAINITSQSIQDNINYKDCSYIGLTHNSLVNDSFVIQYNDEKLKVLYVNPIGKLKQVFLKRI